MNLLTISGLAFIVLVVLLAVTVSKANSSGENAVGYGLYFIVELFLALISLIVFFTTLFDTLKR